MNDAIETLIATAAKIDKGAVRFLYNGQSFYTAEEVLEAVAATDGCEEDITITYETVHGLLTLDYGSVVCFEGVPYRFGNSKLGRLLNNLLRTV